MTETESDLHDALDRRDAHIEGLEAEIKRLTYDRDVERESNKQLGEEVMELRATITRVEALLVCDCGCEGPAAAVTGVTLRAALATQPTEARP